MPYPWKMRLWRSYYIILPNWYLSLSEPMCVNAPLPLHGILYISVNRTNSYSSFPWNMHPTASSHRMLKQSWCPYYNSIKDLYIFPAEISFFISNIQIKIAWKRPLFHEKQAWFNSFMKKTHIIGGTFCSLQKTSQ